MMLSWVPQACLALTLVAACVWDIRTRQVPAWLTVGSLVLAVTIAATQGLPALGQAALGLMVGALLSLPLVWRGGLGAADMLLLGAVAAWEGWRLALWTAWWAAIAGAVLAIIAWRLRKRAFAYALAIAIGFGLAALA